MGKVSKFRSQEGYHEELKNRTDETVGGNYITIFVKDTDLNFWKDKEGDHALDVIPWISSENHPNYPKGKPVYKVEIWVHKHVGPEKGDYICLRNYGEDCPLCDAKSEEMAKDNPRKKVVEALKGSQRCLYNVVVYTDNQEQNGVQIWEASSYLAEGPFKETAKNKRTGERIPYSDPDRGKTITFTIAGKNKGKKLTGIVFEDRPEPIADEILDQAYTIEDYLVKPEVEDLKLIAKAVLSGVSDEDDEPELPVRSRRRGEDSEKEEPEPRKERETSKQEEEPPPRRGRRTEEESGGLNEEPEKKKEEEPEPRRNRRQEPEPEPEKKADEPPPTRRLRRRD